MTTPSTTRRAGPFLGTGTQTAFPFAFRVFSAADIKVLLADEDSIESEVPTSGYSVTVNADQDASPGGTVNMVTAPAIGESLAVVGGTPYSQTLDLPNGGAFSPRAVENAFDRTVFQIQQLAEETGRSLTIPATAAGASTTLPVPEASRLLGWNATANGLQNYDPAAIVTAQAFANWTPESFTGDGERTQFALAGAPGSLGNIDVAVGGVTQTATEDYSLAGNILTFVTAPPDGVRVFVRYGTAAVASALGTIFEERTSTAGQTVFTTTTDWVPGAGMLRVYVDGWRVTDYLEGADNTVTFTSPLPAGREVLFEIGQLSTAGLDATQVGYTAAGTGSVAHSAANKFGELPSVVDKGADPTGAADSVGSAQAAVAEGPAWLGRGAYRFDTALTGQYRLVGMGASFTGAGAPDAAWPAFGTGALRVISVGGNNAFIGVVDNNLPAGSASFPTAVTGYARVSGNGNVVFGLFGRADLYASGGGVATNEVNCFNYAGTPSSAYPPSIGFGTTERSPIGLIVAAGGTHDSHIGVMLAREGEAPRSFRTGLYSHPQAVTDYGVFVDADASNGPTLPVLVKHKAGSVAMQLQTVGTAAPDNAVLQVVDPAAAVVFGVRQNGRLAFTSGITQTTVGAAGGASALPATPTGYLRFLVGSTQFVIPYYAAA